MSRALKFFRNRFILRQAQHERFHERLGRSARTEPVPSTTRDKPATGRSASPTEPWRRRVGERNRRHCFGKVLLILIFNFTSIFSFFTDQKAAQAYRAKDYVKARALYESQVERNPHDAQALYNLGKTAYKLADYENARKCFEKAFASETARTASSAGSAGCGNVQSQLQEQAAFELGDSCFQLDQLDDALCAYNRVIEINKDNAHARKRIEMVKKRQQERKQEQEQKDPQGQDTSDRGQDKKDTQESQQSQDNEHQKQQNQDKDKQGQQKQKDSERKKQDKNKSGSNEQKNKGETGDKQNKPDKRDAEKPDNRDHEQAKNTGEQPKENKKTEHDKRTDHNKNGAGKNSQQQHEQKQDKTEHDKLPDNKKDSADKRKQDGQKQQVGAQLPKEKSDPKINLNQQEQQLLQCIEAADSESYRRLINQEVKQAAGTYDESHGW